MILIVWALIKFLIVSTGAEHAGQLSNVLPSLLRYSRGRPFDYPFPSIDSLALDAFGRGRLPVIWLFANAIACEP